jgi:hypothetical protein
MLENIDGRTKIPNVSFTRSLSLKMLLCSLFYVRFSRQSISGCYPFFRQPIKRSTTERLARRLSITTTNTGITTLIYYIIMFQRILLIALLAIAAISSTEVCTLIYWCEKETFFDPYALRITETSQQFILSYVFSVSSSI